MAQWLTAPGSTVHESRPHWGPAPPPPLGPAGDPTAGPITPFTDDPAGAGGECGDDCNSCPKDQRGALASDPVLLPERKFVQVETDFTMTERGARFVIQRSYNSDGVDWFLATDYGGYADVQRARNTVFGVAWSSTLQMHTYWRYHGCDDYIGGQWILNEELVQHVNLGGYYIHDLRPVGYEGYFAGPMSYYLWWERPLKWLRFDPYPGADYSPVASSGCEAGHRQWCPRTRKNPGVVTTRDGTRFYFDYGFDPNDPNANVANADNIIQLLRRRENRYGQGYDYEYSSTGTVGSGNVQYRIERVRTPAGRYLAFRYDPNYYGYDDPNQFNLATTCPNHVTSVDLLNASQEVLVPDLVHYDYYGPNHPNAPGQLAHVRKGCDCSGAGGGDRYYEYACVRLTESYLPRDWYLITRIRDAQQRVLLENDYEPDGPGRYRITQQHTPLASDPEAQGTWTYSATQAEGENWSLVTDPNGQTMGLVMGGDGQPDKPHVFEPIFGDHSVRWEYPQGWDSSGYAYSTLFHSSNRPDGVTEAYSYDGAGRRTKTVYATATETFESETLEYTDANHFSQVTKRYEPNDPNIFWDYQYDTRGNVTQVTGPTVTKGVLASYQPVDQYGYAEGPDANDPNLAGNWGLMTNRTDPNGMVTKYEYDTYGYLRKRTVDYGGANLLHTYDVDDFGRTLTYTDPNGAVTEYLYTPGGQVEWVFSPEGQIRHNVYDPNTGWLTEEIVFINPGQYDPNTADPNDPNAASVTTYLRHPTLGHVLAMTQTGAGTTTYGYDAMGRLARTITARGLEVRREYDGFGRLKRVFEKEPGGSERKVLENDIIDPMGRVLQITRYDDPCDPQAGRTTGYAYNAMGWLTARTEPDNTTFHMDYDAAGRVTRQYVKDASQAIVSDTTFEHDELGRVWQQRDRFIMGQDTEPNDRIVSTYRYRDGKTARVVQTGAGATDYFYGAAGRLTDANLPGGVSIHYLDYYANGQVKTQETHYPNARVTRVEYQRNTIGQVEHVTNVGDPNFPPATNETTSYTYTATGQLETRTDPDSRVTLYGYDAQGRLIGTMEDYGGPLARATVYQYGDSGDLDYYVGWNSGGPQLTHYEHDARGNVEWITYPNGDQVHMTYDYAGRVLTRDVPGGPSIGYEYNSRGMLFKRTGWVPKQGGGQNVYEDAFTYDTLGRMTSAIRKLNGDQTSKVEFAYDTLGRLLSETQTIGTVAKTVEYPNYDQADRRKQMILPEEDVAFTYDYDAAGRLHSVGRVKPDANDVIATYAYDGPAVTKRRVTMKHNPDLHVDWDVGRDGLLRLTSSTSTRVPDDPNHARIFASFVYERALMGDPNSEIFVWSGDANDVGATKRSFAYDSLHRLTQVTYGTDPNTSPKEVFNMDLAGNRISYHGRDGSDANYVSNIANQYTHITPPDANLVYDAAGNLTRDHRGYEFTYDHDNKLIKVMGPNMPAVLFEYDALGRRIKKTDWGTSTVRYYVSSGQNEVAEYNAAGTRLRYYVHGPTYIDERVILHDDATNKDYVYLLKDLYTVSGLADERAWPVEYYDYDAYGQVHMYRCAMLPFAADLDGDNDVDNDDLAIFKQCYKGSGNEPNNYAGGLGWLADLDGDGDVDGSDYVLFAHCWNGSGNPPRDPNPETQDPVVSLGSMPVSRVGNPYFFTGRRLDVFDIHNAGTPHHFTDDYAGLTIYDFRRRIDLPHWGRFGQRDPLEPDEQYTYGPNPYSYALDRPSRFVDPEGLGPVIPPGSEIEIVLDANSIFGNNRPCGSITLTGLRASPPNLTWTDLEPVLGPLSGCAPFKALFKLFMNLLMDKVQKQGGYSKNFPCPTGLICCNMHHLEGTYPVTVTLKPIELKNAFGIATCRVEGSITAVATMKADIGGCVKK
jgi:YD repeat-containing protein